ncbi:hypothetical protein, partial [Streptomyces sp. NPDC086787]|uniref:hypothetical protein n=1 Tax=Streptomyces sp. NPDC086787 TaxID=3365759 RepID=UPI00381D8DA2
GTGVGSVSLVDSHITGNSSPSAPAPGGVWTDTQYTVDGLSTITDNTPTNCLLSPVLVTGCAN